MFLSSLCCCFLLFFPEVPSWTHSLLRRSRIYSHTARLCYFNIFDNFIICWRHFIKIQMSKPLLQPCSCNCWFLLTCLIPESLPVRSKTVNIYIILKNVLKQSFAECNFPMCGLRISKYLLFIVGFGSSICIHPVFSLSLVNPQFRLFHNRA